MGITTVFAVPREYSQSQIMEDVMVCFRRQPGVPLSLGRVADSLAGVTLAQVEQAVKKLEGRVPGREKDAYLHFCRINCSAVYIP